MPDIEEMPVELAELSPGRRSRLKWLRANYNRYLIIGPEREEGAVLTDPQQRRLGYWDSVLKRVDSLVPENVPPLPEAPSGLCPGCNQPYDAHLPGYYGNMLCPPSS